MTNKNTWINKLIAGSYPVAQKLHGLFLHFKTERYSYPKYLGKSGFSKEIHRKNTTPKEMMIMNDVLNKVGDRNLDKFLILNAIAGIDRPDELRSRQSIIIYDNWIETINSRGYFYEKCESHLLSNHCLGSDVSGCLDWASAQLGDLCTAFVDCATTSNSGLDRVSTLSDLFSACYLIHRKPEIEAELRKDVLHEILLNKILKIKDFTDSWCLT